MSQTSRGVEEPYLGEAESEAPGFFWEAYPLWKCAPLKNWWLERLSRPPPLFFFLPPPPPRQSSLTRAVPVWAFPRRHSPLWLAWLSLDWTFPTGSRLPWHRFLKYPHPTVGTFEWCNDFRNRAATVEPPMWLLNFTRIMLALLLCATLGAAKLVAPLMEVESLLLFRWNAELKPYDRRRHPRGHRTEGEHGKEGWSEGDTQEVGCISDDTLSSSSLSTSILETL